MSVLVVPNERRGSAGSQGFTRGTYCVRVRATRAGASLGPGHWPAWPCGITDHDLAIWVGDLNYRLAVAPAAAAAAAQPGSSNSGAGAAAAAPVAPKAAGGGGLLTDADARAAIRSGKLDALINVDQLHRERTAGRVFKVGRNS